MTLEEFKEKLKNELRFTPDDDKDSIYIAFTLQGENYSLLVDKHRKDGDLMDFYFKENERNPYMGYVIMAFLSAQEIASFKNEKESYYITKINEHIQKDDLENWILDKKECDNIYNFLIEKKSVQDYLINKHNKEDDLEKWFLGLKKDNEELFDVINKQRKLQDILIEKIKNHIHDEDLESWLTNFKKTDNDVYDFYMKQTIVKNALIEKHIKSDDLENWLFAEYSRSEQISLLKSDNVRDYLIDKHIKENDLEIWLFSLKKNDNDVFNFYMKHSEAKKSLKECYSQKITEHRATGDLMDYLWELSEKGVNLRVSSYYYSSDIEESTQKYPFESLILNPLLLSSEKKELEELRNVIISFGESFEDYALTTTWKDEFKYIFKLSQSPKDSIEYKRYQKIRSKITKAETLEKLDKSIAKTILISRLKKIGIIAGAALILILVGAFTINRAVTKNARMAKKEAQRIERVKVKKTKDIKKAQAYDLRQLEKLSAKKLSKQELLVQTAEPTMYVIAPMSYDTKKFSQDNSHDSAMFGFKTVDNSVERLGILETCITDFENNVDEITGVSFLDRSKISQIEKEHKFQLGDWSNNKKTAEVGKALNANILLFLDKFTYVDAGSGQYRFEAKFVDVNTMQSSSFVVAYKNPKKKIVTPEVISQISFRDFTPISTKNDSLDDELYLKTQNVIRTVQKKDMKIVSPLGAVTKVQTSEFDVNTPKTEFANASSIKFDGFGELELDLGNETKSYSYTFDANEIFIERNGYNFYTDGKIGVLTVKTDGGYEKFDVFTDNNREYYLRFGSVELEKAFVNYYLQMIKQ